MTSAEAPASRRDARDRLRELMAVREALLVDADAQRVMSELTTIQSGIRAAKKVLWPHQYPDDAAQAAGCHLYGR